MHQPFSFTARLHSFRYALAGLRTLLLTQHNAWLHAAATVLVTGAGLYFGLSLAEWCWLVLAMTLVWMAEALNTALEFLADAVTQEFHPLILQAKDVAAAAVLIAAIGALVIGLLVFGPHLWPRFA
ncbi:diacylglycerol kinase family protein [Curvibacter sp. PAE-UM]|uniref:diacylglycerol kinase family protein n=1 Tax=Curvibacter sp. PAE-UM TaxID=1714344 RepID=UPI00070CAF23|nr:diacylglycerol kinase family protein [Curvibacter sp. PAE-UM]KRH98482.1 diacylglycerol kinase [Curvibacter sp. PAE-UM]